MMDVASGPEIHDYVIVGAGGAGAILAARLSEDPKTSVLLIERGGKGHNPMLYIPKGFFFTLRSDTLTTTYLSQPLPTGHVEAWQRGRGLGGSTAVNGMMYVRGQEADYVDLSRAMGNHHFGWDNMLAAYKAMEDHSLGASAMRGAGGPLGVTVPRSIDDETVDLALAAAEKIGWNFVEDVNAQDQQQIGFTPSTVKNGIRQSTANSFLWPHRRRKNLTVLTGTEVGLLRFEGNRVVGVAARRGDQLIDYSARKEVILAAGAVETPLLMERSGIGRGDVLTDAGVAVRVESPNVGERMIEQHGATIQVRFKREIGKTLAMSSRLKQAKAALQYVATRRGPVGTGGYDLMAHVKSSDEVERPDIQVVGIPFGLDFTSGMDPSKEPGMYLLGYQIRPNTTSSIHIKDALPGSAPEIRARYFEDAEDQAVTSKIVDRLRELTAQEPLAGEIAFEEFPGAAVQTTEQALAYAQDPGMTIYHAVGSVGAGPNDDDPVTPDLRVRGVEGLRVVDISVLPQQVSGNTAAPAMALGWVAADLIRQG